MVIAVNTRLLLKDQLEGIGYFTKEVFLILANKYPEHRFYFLFDREYDPALTFPPNVSPLMVSPPARHPVLWKFWFDLKIAWILRKIKAEVFISPDGFCSLTTSVPQCLVIHDLGFLHQPGAYKTSHLKFYRHYTPKFIKKAQTITTVSEFSKKDIIHNYNTDADKIQVVYSGVKDIFHPLTNNEQDAIKKKYTEGKEYFIYTGAIQPRKNLINLLKAFSIFKKRQKSEMKLVLAGRLAWKNDAFLDLLKTYKYREDVVLTNYVEEKELAKLTASAYSLVYPSLFEGFGVPVLEAMQCNVAVLTSVNSSMQEIAEDAALYFDATNHTDMAEKLMLIYKDESLRSRLIEKGKQVGVNYNWERTANLLWQSVLKAVAAGKLKPVR